MTKECCDVLDINKISKMCDISKSSLKKLKAELEKKLKKSTIDFEYFKTLMEEDDFDVKDAKILFNILDFNKNNILGN